MGNGDTTTVIVSNLSTNPMSYAVTSATPGQDPIVGSLPGRSYGVIELKFTPKIAVTVGDQQVVVGPDGMVTFVPPGLSGLVGTFEFAAPAPAG